jgi:hypothetical protein
MTKTGVTMPPKIGRKPRSLSPGIPRVMLKPAKKRLNPSDNDDPPVNDGGTTTASPPAKKRNLSKDNGDNELSVQDSHETTVEGLKRLLRLYEEKEDENASLKMKAEALERSNEFHSLRYRNLEGQLEKLERQLEQYEASLGTVSKLKDKIDKNTQVLKVAGKLASFGVSHFICHDVAGIGRVTEGGPGERKEDWENGAGGGEESEGGGGKEGDGRRGGG